MRRRYRDEKITPAWLEQAAAIAFGLGAALAFLSAAVVVDDILETCCEIVVEDAQ